MARRSTTHRERRERAASAARAFVATLDSSSRWQLQDDLVLDCLDPSDWIDEKTPPGFWGAVSALLQEWEERRL